MWLRAPAPPTSDLIVPLFLLALLLPFLPWLPDWIPALRALSGPLTSGIWAVVIVAIGWLVWETRLPTSPGMAGPAISRGATALVFVVSLAVYGGAATKLAGSALYPGGDEPHYLVMTQSLLTDGDLRIENNHAHGDYKVYYRNPLNPDYRTRGKNGQIYSIHPIGLPILITPAFAAGGYLGVCWMLAVLAAAAATLAWRAGVILTGSTASATVAWMALAFSAPVVLHSFAVYPETAAGLCALIALWWGGRDQPVKNSEWIGRGVAVAAPAVAGHEVRTDVGRDRVGLVATRVEDGPRHERGSGRRSIHRQHLALARLLLRGMGLSAAERAVRTGSPDEPWPTSS